MNEHFVGIDIGGTTTKVCLIDDAGLVLADATLPTPASGTAPLVQRHRFLAELETAVSGLAGQLNHEDTLIAGCGIAVPGLIDRRAGRVRRCINVDWLTDAALADELTECIGVPVMLETDAAAATWAEYHAIARPGVRFVHLRLGTGVGCAAVVDGRLDRLDRGRLGHLDMLVIDHTSGARRCPCGSTGCLETVASGRALADASRAAGFSGQLSKLRQERAEGNPAACVIFDAAAVAVVRAIRNIQQALEPDVVCLGGGVLQHMPELAEQVVVVCSRDRSAWVRATAITTAHCGNMSGAVGVALLARVEKETS